MKKFKFQLETLLKVTQRKKDDAELKFAEVSRRLDECKRQLEVYLSDMKQCQLEYTEKTSEGKTITIGEIMNYNSYFNWKRQQIEEQQQLILKTTKERQEKLKNLMDLMTYLKSIEQLKEKRLREYNDELLFEEQKMLDEIGLQLHIRNN